MKIKLKKPISEEKQKDIEWSKNVKDRDGWKCVICGNTERPNAHHIIVRECREYRWNIDNGCTLCISHHKFSRHISAHNNAVPFIIWLMKNRPEQWERVRQMAEEAMA